MLSGARNVVEKVLMTIGKKGAYLQVSHAFHSPLMQEMEEEFRVFASSLDINQPLSVPMASTVNGKIIAAGETLTVEHWVTQIASPVLFESSFTNAMNDHNSRQTHIDVIVEIGPNAILSAMARSWWKPDDDQNSPLWIASLERKRDKIPETIASVKAYLGKNLYSTNLLESVFPNRVRIPWVKDAPHPLLQRSVSHSRGVEYHTTFHDKLMSFYKNHLINDKILFPTAGMIEAGLAAGFKRCATKSVIGEHQVEMLGAEFSMPFEIKTGSKMLCEHYSHGKMELRIDSDSGDDSAFATIQQINTAISPIAATTPLKYWKKCHTRQVPGIIDRYEILAAKGFHRGAFQSISSVWLNEDHKSVLGQIILPTDHKHKHDGFYHVHPALLDGVFQLQNFLMETNEQEESFVPSSISRFVLHRPLSIASEVWACVKVKTDGPIKLYDIEVCDETGVLIVVDNLSYRQQGEQVLLPSALKISKNIVQNGTENLDRDNVTDKVESAVHSVMNVCENFNRTSDLFDEGLESLSVVELSTILNAEFDIEVASTIIFSRSSIAALAEYIYEILSKKNLDEKDLAVEVNHEPNPKRKLHVPNHKFQAQVQQRNAELYQSGFSSYFMNSSTGILHEVIDSFYDEKCHLKGNVLLLTGVNISVSHFSSFMVNIRKQGFRVITIAQMGLERTQFDANLNPKCSVAERVLTNIEMMDAILRSEGEKYPSCHVTGNSYGGICGLLLGL